jgi:hypothetical protein
MHYISLTMLKHFLQTRIPKCLTIEYKMIKLVDVKGDGSCFFRSIYKVLRHNKHKLTHKTTEDEFVTNIRTILHEIVIQEDATPYSTLIHDIYTNLKTLSSQDYKMLLESSFPKWFVTRFKRSLPASESIFRKQYAKGILEKSNWVSEIEVRLLSLYMKKNYKLNIKVYNKPPRRINKTNTISVLNKGEYHYNAIISVDTPTQHTPKTPQSPKTKPKECPSTHIRNPKTNRCVSRTSCKGYEVIASTVL